MVVCHRGPAGPAVVGRAAHRRVVDVRDVLDGTGRRRRATVVVVDELGFHQATSVAELLADRGCRVEVVTNGMVVGQDLGITLDMETWNVEAHAKGIVQSDRPGAAWAVPGEEDRAAGRCTLQHHPTGTDAEPRRATGSVCAVPQPRTRCGRNCGPW